MSPTLGLAEDRLNAKSPDLSIVASQAAIELDSVVRGRDSDLVSVCELATVLDNSFSTQNVGRASMPATDSGTLLVVERAVSGSSAGAQPENVDELLSRVRQMAADLLAVASAKGDLRQVDPDVLKHARDFSAALANASSSYLRGLEDLRPTNPFRR
jgi:hypothetical protein